MSQPVSRRSFLRAAALGSAGLALSGKLMGQSARLPRKPNLLVFLPDQQRADTLACYGARHSFAPNLDKLAAQSCVFDRAYITHPVCTPSRSSLMTGTWPHANGCTHNNVRLEPTLRCLPEMIDDTDYRTGYMGKWHLGDEVFAQHGFQEWVSIMDMNPNLFSPGRDHKAVSDYHNFLVSHGLKPERGRSTFSHRYSIKLPLELSRPRFLEANACQFLERHRSEPFILFVAFLEPHPPYFGPLNREHPREEIDEEPTAAALFGDDMPLRYRVRQELDKHKFAGSANHYLKLKQRYLGLVTEVDRSIGGILEKLEQLGLADDTIVVHTSDHGDMMGAHRLFGKKVFFEEATRVPYLVRLPQQRRSVRVAQQVSHIDFLPTMLDLLGQTPHEQCVGQSRAGLLRQQPMPPETIFLEWSPDRHKLPKLPKSLGQKNEIQRALAESTRAAFSPDGWKLCLRDLDKNELYNLKADPREEHNLYNNSDCKEVIARLTRQIYGWQEIVRDQVKVEAAAV